MIKHEGLICFACPEILVIEGCRTGGCMGASGFGVAPVDGIVMNVLIVEINITCFLFPPVV